MFLSIFLIGFTLLGSGISRQLSYEDVHEKAQQYGSYVLDDMVESFKEPNISKIRIDPGVAGFSTIRVEFNDGTSDIKYSVSGPVLGPNEIHKNNEPIHENNNTINQYFNQFKNHDYAVVISKFKCNELGYAGNTEFYGNRPFDGNKLENAVYLVDMQLKLYKEKKGVMELYNTIDFQRTIFVTDEFI